MVELQRLLWLYSSLFGSAGSVAVATDEFRPWLFGSRLQTPLKRRLGLLTGLAPVARSAQSMFLGILPSSMRLTWPSQRSCL